MAGFYQHIYQFIEMYIFNNDLKLINIQVFCMLNVIENVIVFIHHIFFYSNNKLFRFGIDLSLDIYQFLITQIYVNHPFIS